MTQTLELPQWTIGDRLRKSLDHADISVQDMADYLELSASVGHMPPRTAEANLLTAAEACRLLHIDRSTLNRWARSGRIVPALKLPGARGANLFTAESVHALVGRS